VRFLLDHDVDAAVARMLRRRGHECWTASAVGLATARDDDLTVWATEHNSAVVSTDREFGLRRMKNAIGHHVWLRCPDWEASEVLAAHLDQLIELLTGRRDVTARLSTDAGLQASSDWR
jgi:predicted nuclease of predicted toxin-antitoxin system